MTRIASCRRGRGSVAALVVLSGLLWSALPAEAAPPAALQGERARLGLSASDIADVVVTRRYMDRDTGVTHMYLRQRHRGLDVIDGTMTMTLARDGSVASVGDRFVRGLADKAPGVIPGQTAVAARGAATRSLRAGRLAGGAPRPRLVYAKGGAGDVRLAWTVRIEPVDGRHLWDAVVDAQSLELLRVVDWVADAGSYNVFAPPLDNPLEGPRTLVIDPADPLASPYGWHDTDGAPGAESTRTIGNNVHAGTDVNDDDVFDPGSEPDGGAGLQFDFPLDLTQPPSTYRPAAVTNLFFWINHLHDVTYRYGFTEAAGNFQQNNYGRGGLGGDAVLAEAQNAAEAFDCCNAFMHSTPDGSPPRMEILITPDFLLRPVTLQVNAPAAIAGPITGVRAEFGTDTDPAGVTALVALADDGVGVGSDACEPPPAGSLAGRIALVDRGTCGYIQKALNVQAAGALGEIVVQNTADPPETMTGSGAVTIPAAMISLADGNTIKAALADTVEVTFIVPPPRPDRDGSFDAGTITHEYTHGISNRLTGGGGCGLTSGEPQGMGEGWSDYVALAMTQKATDTATTPRAPGNYFYFSPLGIRETPYSTDMTVDGATYDTIKQSPQQHFVGWVWASMLWDLHWRLGGDDTALQLVFDGLKIQPCSPGFVDARNAILTADELRNGGQNACAIWQAFARRGLGAGATQGSPGSTTDGTQSFEAPSAACAPTAVDVTVSERGDGDGVEPGEAIAVTGSFRNPGEQNVDSLSLALSGGDLSVFRSPTPFPDLPAGTTAQNPEPLLAKIPASAQCGTDASATLTLTGSHGTTQVPVQVALGSPRAPTDADSGDVPKAIPDNRSTGVNSTLTVAGLPGPLLDVDVRIASITHTAVSDLVIKLTSPAGTTVTLANRNGGSGQNFTQTVFDDAATYPISLAHAPFTGSFRPAQPLSAFDGEDGNGTWTLNVADLARLDTGTLNAWGLTATPAVCSADPTPPTLGFTSSPASPQIGQAVQFESTATDNGPIERQRWDLDNDGDFDDATGTNATHTFDTAGAHTVRLEVIDDRLDTYVHSETITVGYQFLGFFSPLPKSSWKAGATIPVKFALADTNGTRITDAQAQAIADNCDAKITFTGGTPSPDCFTYDALIDTFQLNLNTPKTLSANHTITATITSAGSVVNTNSVQITIKR